jgi:hypothetical protein
LIRERGFFVKFAGQRTAIDYGRTDTRNRTLFPCQQAFRPIKGRLILGQAAGAVRR